MDHSSSVTHLGLCAGYGGIELGLHRAVPNMRSVAFCEIEAFAIANLVAKMEAGHLDPAPVWPDLKTFPWAAFRDRVDILTGGYPCQPFSAAGQRKGKQDPRHLWPWIADGIRLLRPRCCFFENVEGHISLGLSDVIEDLAGMGYRTTWGLFSAAEVGAPHQRKRVFIMAVASGLGGVSWLSRQVSWHEGQSGESDDGCGQDVGNAISQRVERAHNNGSLSEGIQSDSIKSSAWPSRPGEQQYWWEPPRVVSGRQAMDDTQERCLRDDSDNQRQAVGEGDTANDSGSCSGEAMANTERTTDRGQATGNEAGGQNSERSAGGFGGSGEELGDAGCERQEDRQLPSGWSEQSDQNMADTSIIGSDGRPDGISWGSREPGEAGEDVAGCGGESNGMRQTQPPLGGDVDGTSGRLDHAELYVSSDNRTDELRLLGNGVVPATAERAFRVLSKALDRYMTVS